jgi:hypothetical protein
MICFIIRVIISPLIAQLVERPIVVVSLGFQQSSDGPWFDSRSADFFYKGGKK